MELRNDSENKFTEIASEEYREYRLSDGDWLRIEATHLHVSASGGHRLLDRHGVSWYLKASDWNALRWKAKDGQPHFVK